MKKFERKNTVSIYSKYRSVNGYTLFYMVDIKNNLISPILRSHSAPLNFYNSYKQNEVKNFKEVKKLHKNASETYIPLGHKKFSEIIYKQNLTYK